MMDIFTALATTVLALVILYYFTNPSNFAAKQGIKGPLILPIVGQLFSMISHGIVGFYDMCRNKYGKIVRVSGVGGDGVAIFDVDLLKQVMIKESTSFSDHTVGIKMPRPFDKGLTVLTGDDWRRVRHAITPTFTSGKLKKMVSIIDRSVTALSQKLDSTVKNNEEVNVRDVFSRFTMDVIADTMFGMKTDSLSNDSDPFTENAKRIMTFNTAAFFKFAFAKVPILNVIVERLFGGIFDTDALNFFVNVVDRAIKERRGREHEFHDFLSLMLKCEITEDAIGTSEAKVRGLTNDEMISQSVFFMLAGYETTSLGLTYASFILASRPEVQERLREEISTTFCDDSPEEVYDSLSKMSYLDQCIKEILRMYPPAPRTDRIANNNVTIGNLKIPKGGTVIIPIHAILHDPELWSNPEEFIPERFAGEDGDIRKLPFQFLVFGGGPRNCIGLRFALLELKLVLVKILKSFRFVPCDKTPKEPIEYGFRGVATPKTPIVLKLEAIDEKSLDQ